MNLLIIDDDELDREMVRRALVATGEEFELEEVTNSQSALEILNKKDFDCLILDYLLPGVDGLTFLRELAIDSDTLHIPVVMITGEGNEEVAVEAMKLGVYDYITKQKLTSSSLLSAIKNALRKEQLQRQLDEANAAIKRMALYDSLTGLGNRYMFDDRVKELMAVSSRKDQPFAVLMLDLDNFKKINDNHGHLMGDRVLATVGSRLRNISRSADLIFRTGGDEFIILLETGVSHEGVLHFSKKIIEELKQSIIIDSDTFTVSASIGIAFYPKHGKEVNTLIHHADAAMYAAKRSGGGISIVELEEN